MSDSKRTGLVLPRQRAPHFNAKGVLGGSIEEYKSEDYVGKWLVLLFYPYDFTFVCPTELHAFSGALSEFNKLGAEVRFEKIGTGVIKRDPCVPAKEGGVGMLNIPLVGDHTKKISKDYGVLVEDENDEMVGACLRGLFIIDPKFVVRSVVVNDEAVGRSVPEVIRLIQAFQHADIHGETCPANWRPGDDAIPPDHQESKNFFKKWGANKD